MNRIAEFSKVSYDEFAKSYKDIVGELDNDALLDIYNNIKLPKRATTGSAGYDFYLPYDIEVKPGEEITLVFGVRAKISEGWVLQIYPRSGLGRRYRFQLNNLVGIIDSDYYYAENEGHILTPMANCSFDKSDQNKILKLKSGTAAVQGVFVPFGITFDDKAEGIRTGGFGSTSK